MSTLPAEEDPAPGEALLRDREEYLIGGPLEQRQIMAAGRLNIDPILMEAIECLPAGLTIFDQHGLPILSNQVSARRFPHLYNAFAEGAPDYLTALRRSIESSRPDFTAEQVEEWTKTIAGYAESGETYEHPAHDGQIVQITYRPMSDGRKVAISVDVTQLRQNEKELRRAKRAADAANLSKSTFLANMSHEIRTPMSTVIGMLEVLMRTPLTEAQREHAAIALKSSRDLLHVLNDVLDASAIEAGRVSIQNRPFSVRTLLTEKLSMFGLRAEQKGLTLTTTVAVDVPEWQLADERRLHQVMNNLIGNALKYTETGVVEIAASFNDEHGKLRIEVTDTGVGISETAQRDLFQPFAQTDSTLSRKYEGSGLGLSISRNLVELMGGQIGVSSRPGEGSTFWLELPAPACEEADEGHSPDRPDVVPPLRVLVAEDNAAAQRIIEAVLTAMGHTTTIVNNGAQAVAEVASGRYDVVLMDIMMPGMDGPTATGQIRGLGGRAGGIPIIALTADILFGADGRYLLAGMTDFVSKPIDVALLTTALMRASSYADQIADIE